MLLSFVLIGAALAHCSYALLHHSRRLQARGTSPEIIWNMVWTGILMNSAGRN